MGAVSAYLGSVDANDRIALERVNAIARRVVPEAEEGTSYATAARIYRGKGLVATLRAKNCLSLYSLSGAVVAANLDALAGFETTSGSIHYSVEHQLSDALLRRIVEARQAEIDAKVR